MVEQWFVLLHGDWWFEYNNWLIVWTTKNKQIQVIAIGVPEAILLICLNFVLVQIILQYKTDSYTMVSALGEGVWLTDFMYKNNKKHWGLELLQSGCMVAFTFLWAVVW